MSTGRSRAGARVEFLLFEQANRFVNGSSRLHLDHPAHDRDCARFLSGATPCFRPGLRSFRSSFSEVSVVVQPLDG
ncbi:hypothetical protein HRbin30_03332 [bacterium HR30]|nr:hypothetical protein HRbin30_03332 [bacterium HR30]